VSVVAPTVKKFLNSPDDIVQESLAGLGPAREEVAR